MKNFFKTLFILAALLWAGNLNSQMVLENTYYYSATITSTDGDEYNYFLMDPALNQCRVYDSQHSLLKTIALTVPTGYTLCDIRYVSDKLFNPDDLLELLYISCQYVTVDAYWYYKYDLRVVNELGEQLLSVPGAGLAEVHDLEDTESRLLVYVYDYSMYPYKTYTQVYRLPGSHSSSLKSTSSFELLGEPMPNPAGTQVSISYHLSEPVTDAILQLTDISGRVLLTRSIAGSSGSERFPVEGLPRGMYQLSLMQGGAKLDQKKIIRN